MTKATIGGIDPTTGTIPVGGGTSFSSLYTGTANTVLTSNGTGNLPSWKPAITWNTNTTTGPYPMLPFNGYVSLVGASTGTSVYTLPLPSTNPSVGDIYILIGATGPLQINCSTGQTIYFGNSFGPSLYSFPTMTAFLSAITLICITSSSFAVLNTNGATFSLSALSE